MTTIGTDLDGCLAISYLNVREYRPYHLHEYFAQCRPGPLCRGDFDYIVTGRKIHYRKITIKWLKQNNVDYGEIHFFPNKRKKTNRSLAIYKAELIEELEVDLFYEDDLRIGQFLKKSCKHTKIIRVDIDNSLLELDIQ